MNNIKYITPPHEFCKVESWGNFNSDSIITSSYQITMLGGDLV